MSIKRLNSYYQNRHSYFLLNYHLILTTTGSDSVFISELKDYLNEFIESMMSKNECSLTKIEYDKNHVHILFDAPIMLNLPNFVNGMKSTSSRMIRRKFYKYVDQFVGDSGFWRQSYFLITQSESNDDVISEYIRTEGE